MRERHGRKERNVKEGGQKVMVNAESRDNEGERR